MNIDSVTSLYVWLPLARFGARRSVWGHTDHRTSVRDSALRPRKLGSYKGNVWKDSRREPVSRADTVWYDVGEHLLEKLE